MIQKLQNAGKFITTSGSGYIPPSRDDSSKKSPTAATINQWLKGTFSYITGIKDSDLIESKYRPSKETNITTKYYTRKGLDYDVMRNLLGGKESSAKTFEGEPLYYKNFNDLYNRLSNKTYRKGRQLRTTDNSHLGEYTIGIGEDNNGRYVSYYDKFDWAPNEKLEIFFPYEIYNRIYEKDFNRMQKELNNETYSGSNPSGNWFFKSGMNNKGYFKFGGKTANARKWKHKEGGIIIKAADGTKTNNFFQKAGNFLNSDFGKGILSLGAQIFGGLKTGSDIADFSNSFDQATDSKVKAMDSKMRATSYQKGLQKAKETIAQKQLENPDVKYGEIDLMKMAQDFSNEFYDAEAIDNYKTQRAQEKLQQMQAIQGSASSGFADVIQNGLGMVGNFLNNKKSTTPTTTTSNNITQSLLNYSTIGKSTNPYMYTGLGANYNAKTLFS